MPGHSRPRQHERDPGQLEEVPALLGVHAQGARDGLEHLHRVDAPLRIHPVALAAALAAVMIMSFFTVNVALGSIGADLDVVWSPLIGIVLSQIPGHMAGLGSGLLITTMQAGLGLGAAVIGSVYLAQADGFAPTAYLLGAVMLVIAGLTRLLEPQR